MKRFLIGFISIISFIFIFSCAGTSSDGSSGEKIAEVPFPYKEVPSIINSSQKDVSDYLTTRFWNNFMDTNRVYTIDSTMVAGVIKRNFQKAFDKYLGVIYPMGQEKLIEANKSMIAKAISFSKTKKDTMFLETIASLLKRYFYDPNSPYRNDEILIPALEQVIASKVLPSIDESTYRYTLERAKINRVGEASNDFEYMTNTGRLSTLNKFKSKYTMVFFNNPDCVACREIIEYILNSKAIDSVTSKGELKIIALYLGQDIEKWMGYAKRFPKNWISCYDPTYSLEHGTTYDIKAIPTIYFLDRDKKIILKDPDIRQVEQYFTGKKS